MPVLRAARKRLQIVRIGQARGFAVVFVRAVDRNFYQPAFERFLVAQPFEGLPCTQNRFADRVLRVRVARKQRPCGAVHRAAVFGHGGSEPRARIILYLA